jgi:hypothetical protein
MRTALGRLLIVIAVPALAACTMDAAEVEEPRTGEIRTLQASDCPTILNDDVVSSLGWSGAAQPQFKSTEECQVETEQGSVTLSRRPVPAVGGDDLPDKARASFDERCALIATSSGTSGEVADWFDVPDSGASCAALDVAPHGASTLVLLTPGHAVLEIRVETDQATPGDTLRAGLSAAGEQALSVFGQG